MDKKQRLFQIAFVAWVAFALLLVAGTVNRDFGRMLLSDTDRETELKNTGYTSGDLYYMCYVSEFREKILTKEYGKFNETHTYLTADIITIGDSFFVAGLDYDQIPPFPFALENATGKRVYHLGVDWAPSPACYLKQVGYFNPGRKVLILESIERSIPYWAESYNNECPGAPSRTVNLSAPSRTVSLSAPSRVIVPTPVSTPSQWEIWWTKIVGMINETHAKLTPVFTPPESDVEYLFSHNLFVSPIDVSVRDTRFFLMHDMDKRIGAYALSPRMLFFQHEVDFDHGRLPFYATDQEIDAIAEKIARLSVKLDHDYNVTLVYVAIPNKYSIYHNYTRDGYVYNSFVPRLNDKLMARNVTFVDVYTPYIRMRDSCGENCLLYHPSDTHYNALGRGILVNETKKVLDELGAGG